EGRGAALQPPRADEHQPYLVPLGAPDQGMRRQNAKLRLELLLLTTIARRLRVFPCDQLPRPARTTPVRRVAAPRRLGARPVPQGATAHGREREAQVREVAGGSAELSERDLCKMNSVRD